MISTSVGSTSAGSRRTIQVIPSARRLIGSLRDIGYDFPTAVADIVDNSIAAGARNVRIDIRFEGDNSRVLIADDGVGMDSHTLTAAMRYGTERTYGVQDLGRFGLGLKTASLSQCRRLTVASRSDPEHRRVAIRRWDLELIEKTDTWELVALGRSECPPHLIEPLRRSPGTVVLWERLDRMLGYRYPYGEVARKRLLHMTRELEMHLAMVFHRFLSGEAHDRQVNLFINDNRVQPWDPFARAEPGTRSMLERTILVEDTLSSDITIRGEVKVTPYILPHQSHFTTNQAFQAAGGPKRWNRQQGLYIYRADRMIQSGGWSGLRTLDEHTKLARIAVDFTTDLDAPFKINVAKMRVQLPTSIRPQVEGLLTPVIQAAQEEYRMGGKSNQDGGGGGQGGKGRTPERKEREKPVEWTLDRLRAELMRIASPEERNLLSRLFERMSQLVASDGLARAREGGEG